MNTNLKLYNILKEEILKNKIKIKKRIKMDELVQQLLPTILDEERKTY